MQGITDGHRHCGTAHCRRESSHGIFRPGYRGYGFAQSLYAKLKSDGIDDRADQEGAEQTLRHRPHGVNPIALCGYYDILSFQKLFYAFHRSSPIPYSYLLFPYFLPKTSPMLSPLRAPPIMPQPP